MTIKAKKAKAARLPWQYVNLTPEEWSQISPNGAITKNGFREIVRKIEARRFPAIPKKGMKTPEEIRARMSYNEARADQIVHAPGVRTRDKALELEMFYGWAGALAWVLGEGVERVE